MLLTWVTLPFSILPACLGASPSEPTLTSDPSRPSLTVHEAAITASCVTSLVATSVTCWSINTSRSPMVVQTFGKLFNSPTTTSQVEKRDEPVTSRCVKYFGTVTSCGIGVHPQPSSDGNPTTTMIITTPSSTASPEASTSTTSYAMSIGIIDATTANAAGDNWLISMTGELRNKVVGIANSYCDAIKKCQHEPPPSGGNAGEAIEMVACDLRPLAEEQQNALQDEVQNLLEGEIAEIPANAVDAYAAAGITEQVAQRAVGGAFAVWFRQQLAIGVAVVITAEVVLTRTEMLKEPPPKEPEAISSTSMTTPGPTSTFPSISSSSTSSRICPMCASCKPVAINDDEGQVGASIPARTTTDVVATPTYSYSCFNHASPHETIIRNQGPWCECPDGQYSTSGSIISSGTYTYTNFCPYTTTPPEALTRSPNLPAIPTITTPIITTTTAHNLRTASCDENYGRDYGMIKDDFYINVGDFCHAASKSGWRVPGGNPPIPPPPTYNPLRVGPTPTVMPPHREISLPEVKDKKDRVDMALKVRYDFDACDDPENSSQVDFAVERWCGQQFTYLFDHGQCAGTNHKLESGHENEFFSGGIVYSDCIIWEIYMVDKGSKRMSDVLAEGGTVEKWTVGSAKLKEDSLARGESTAVGNASEWNSTVYV